MRIACQHEERHHASQRHHERAELHRGHEGREQHVAAEDAEQHGSMPQKQHEIRVGEGDAVERCEPLGAGHADHREQVDDADDDQ